MSLSLITKYSVPAYLTSVPAYFSKRTVSPALTVISIVTPLSVTRPAPTAITVPVWDFSLADDGKTMPPIDFS